MDAHFVGQKPLLKWLNEDFDGGISKIEHLASGTKS